MQRLLDDRMTASANIDFRDRAKFRTAPTARQCGVREAADQIEFGDIAGNGFKRDNIALQLLQEFVVEQLFTAQGAILRRQRFIFKGFKLGGDVTLGIFQCLPPAVVFRNFARLRLRYFDIEAVHAVVLNLERGDAGRFALTGFELQQKVATMRLNVSEFVEIGIKAIGDDITVANVDGGFRTNRPGEQVSHARSDREIGQATRQCGKRGAVDGVLEQLSDQRRHCRPQMQRIAQAGEFTWSHRQQPDAAANAFDVTEAVKQRP